VVHLFLDARRASVVMWDVKTVSLVVLYFLFLAGQRLKEGGHINKSLLALGSVIAKLSEGERYGKNNSRFTWKLRSFRPKVVSLDAGRRSLGH